MRLFHPSEAPDMSSSLPSLLAQDNVLPLVIATFVVLVVVLLILGWLGTYIRWWVQSVLTGAGIGSAGWTGFGPAGLFGVLAGIAWWRGVDR